MQIKDIMTPRIETADADATLAEASAKMKSIGRDILPVFRDGQCIGVVSEKSVMAKAETVGLGASGTKVTEALCASVITLPEDTDAEAALRKIDEQPQHDQLQYVLVVDEENRPAGMVDVEALRRRVHGKEPDAGEFAVEAVESISSIADYQDDAVEYMSDESFPASDPPPPPSRMSRDPQDE